MNSRAQLKKLKKRVYILINSNYRQKKITSPTQWKDDKSEEDNKNL